MQTSSAASAVNDQQHHALPSVSIPSTAVASHSVPTCQPPVPGPRQPLPVPLPASTVAAGRVSGQHHHASLQMPTQSVSTPSSSVAVACSAGAQHPASSASALTGQPSVPIPSVAAAATQHHIPPVAAAAGAAGPPVRGGATRPRRRHNRQHRLPYQRGATNQRPPRFSALQQAPRMPHQSSQPDTATVYRLASEILTILHPHHIFLDFYRLHSEMMRSYRPPQ